MVMSVPRGFSVPDSGEAQGLAAFGVLNRTILMSVWAIGKLGGERRWGTRGNRTPIPDCVLTLTPKRTMCTGEGLWTRPRPFI